MGWGSVSVYADVCDSLRRQVYTLPHDSTRLMAMEQTLYCLQENMPVEDQLKYIDEYVKEAESQKSIMVAFGLATRATLFYNNDMNDSVLIAVPRDMERVKVVGEYLYYYEMWSLVAYTYIFMNHNKQGLIETQKMYEDAREQNNLFGMGLSKCIMGTAYSNLRNYDQSIEAFKKSIELLSEIKPPSSQLLDAFTYYGNALNDMKDYRGLEQLTLQWEEFLTGYLEKKKIADTPLADLYWGYYYLACAQASLGLDDTGKAEEALKEAYKHIETTDNYQGMNWLYLMAQLRLKQGDVKDAMYYNTQRMALLNAGGDQTDKVMILQQRAEIMLAQNDYREAAKLFKDICLISDSLNAHETKEQLNEMSTIYGLDEEKMENERLQMESERAQFRFIIIVVSVIVVSLAVFMFFRIRSARRLEQAHAELQTAYDDLQAANNVIEETTAAKERIESELRIARDIQQSMVPAIFPDREDLDLYASMTPAKEVGGDMYSYLLIEETNKLYFALGDVSGKGVPASLFMAQATRLFRTLAKQQLPPAEMATRMNGELAEDNEQGMFITMFIGLLDLKTGHLDFCNAGHNPPVLLTKGDAAKPESAEQESEFIEMIPNAPIGLWPGLEYEGEQRECINGQPLFIYTDGLNEAENRQQEQFTDERLLQLLKDTKFENSQKTVEMLREEVERHRDGADPNDDLTMMCVYLKN